jgi:hypothetical protein
MAADMALAHYRAARAVEMRMAGAEYDHIAQELGFANRSGAWKAVQRALRRQVSEYASAYCAQTLVDLDIMFEKNWSRATHGNLSAIDRCLRISDQRARLLGLYEGTG